MNYETVSYLIYGISTTAVDFAVYTVLRNADVGMGVSQALSWLVTVLFAHVMNKPIVFRNYNMCPSYPVGEVGTFAAARAFSSVVTWVLVMVMVRLGGNKGLTYEPSCKLISSVINMVLNYVFGKLWTLKKE